MESFVVSVHIKYQMTDRRVWAPGNTFRAELFRRQLCRWCSNCESFLCLDIAHDASPECPDMTRQLKRRPNNCPFPSCGIYLEVDYHRFHLCNEFPLCGWQQLRAQGIHRAAINRRLLKRKKNKDICMAAACDRANRRPRTRMSFAQVYVNRMPRFSSPGTIHPHTQSCCAMKCMRLFCLPEFHSRRKLRVSHGIMKHISVFADEHPTWCFYCNHEFTYASDRMIHQCSDTPVMYRTATPYQKDTADAFRNGLERRDHARDRMQRRARVQDKHIFHVQFPPRNCRCINCKRVKNARADPSTTTILFADDEFADLLVSLTKIEQTEAPKLIERQPSKKKRSMVADDDPLLRVFMSTKKPKAHNGPGVLHRAKRPRISEKSICLPVRRKIPASKVTLLPANHASFST